MLEFIVLGQIPGTEFQITFLQIAAFAAMFVVALVAARELDKLLKPAGKNTLQSQIEETAL